MEGGVRRATVGTFADGDRLRVVVHDGLVEYWRNDTLLWISGTKPRYPLLVDVSFGAQASRLAVARLRGTLGSVVEWRDTPGVAAASTEATAARESVMTAGGAPAWPAAVEAALEGDATIGFDLDAAKPGTGTACLTVRGDEVRVTHFGTVRGTWKAEPGVRYRVEIGADGTARYFAGDVRLDEAPAPGLMPEVVVGAATGEGGGRVVFAVVEEAR
jgi:hypothetical protein